ncbi:hypothetical protein QFC20_001091 [Naganishia adeliensis]|uniref:Uncharacterized protein n=1 Tax=Naganishia adeliensis TaxID=92952 RepID=A0ACC2WTY5_9TREE|nr:hypothetical protein QFC20_001091 [Naganishia adeliensis]
MKHDSAPRKLTSTRNPPTKGRRHGDDPSLVPGLTIIEDFITPQQEDHLLQFLDAQPWRTDLARRTMHFGGTYCLMPPRDASSPTTKPEIIQAPPIPPDFAELMDLFYEKEIYTPSAPPEYCIVNEYLSLHGISAHVENYTFGEPVCSLTMHDGDFLRFHQLTTPNDGSVRSGKAQRAQRTGRRVDVWLAPRSLAVLRGDARRVWQHEVVRGRNGRVASRSGEEWRRTSLTFRVKR